MAVLLCHFCRVKVDDVAFRTPAPVRCNACDRIFHWRIVPNTHDLVETWSPDAPDATSGAAALAAPNSFPRYAPVCPACETALAFAIDEARWACKTCGARYTTEGSNPPPMPHVGEKVEAIPAAKLGRKVILDD